MPKADLAEAVSIEHEKCTYHLRQIHPLKPYVWIDNRNTEAPKALAYQLDYKLINHYFGDPDSYDHAIKARQLEKRVEFILRGVSLRRQEAAFKLGVLDLVSELYPSGTEDTHSGILDSMNNIHFKKAIDAYEEAFNAIPFSVYFCMRFASN